MIKVLLTGAAGFIGSAIAKKLIDLDYEVTTIDNFSTGFIENIPSGTRVIEGDCFDEKIIEQLNNERFDAIIHIAGQSSGEISFENPVYDLQTNTQSTIMLLEYAKKTKCPKFIYASSMSVYGEQGDILVTEENIPIPKSFYAVGKMASEQYMRIYSEYGINCISLRFFNVYGEGQNLENLKQGMISIYLAQAIKNHHIVIKGSKDRYRDFVYIDDVVESVILNLNNKNKETYQCYNISTGVKTTVEDIINYICKAMPFPVTYEFAEGTRGDQQGIYGDSKLFEKCTNWKAKNSFEQGMKKMIEWAIKKNDSI